MNTHFPVPPVCTAAWTEDDWKRWAEQYGVDRSGPDYSADGTYEPATIEFAGETWVKSTNKNTRGEALYHRKEQP